MKPIAKMTTEKKLNIAPFSSGFMYVLKFGKGNTFSNLIITDTISEKLKKMARKSKQMEKIAE